MVQNGWGLNKFAVISLGYRLSFWNKNQKVANSKTIMEKDLLLSCLKVILEQQSNSIFDLPICNYDHVKQFAFDNIKNAEEINGLNI